MRTARVDQRWWLWTVTALVGLAVGTASVFPYVHTAGPLHFLGNSAALWLLIAFAVGVLAHNPRRGAIAGTVLLVATVVAFFVTYKLLFPDNHVGRVAAFWLSTALVGGAVFGLAGGVWRDGDPNRRGVTAAIVGGAFIAEAISFQAVGGELWRWLEIVVGVALCLLLATGRRARLVAMCALPACVALGLLGWVVTKHAMHVSLA